LRTTASCLPGIQSALWRIDHGFHYVPWRPALRRDEPSGPARAPGAACLNERASAVTSHHRPPRPLRSLSSLARAIATRRLRWTLGLDASSLRCTKIVTPEDVPL